MISEAQFRRLLILGSGGAVVAPGKRDWAPLLRRGLVAPAWTVPDCRGLGPLRITSAGFAALAEASARYDWAPEYGTSTPTRGAA